MAENANLVSARNGLNRQRGYLSLSLKDATTYLETFNEDPEQHSTSFMEGQLLASFRKLEDQWTKVQAKLEAFLDAKPTADAEQKATEEHAKLHGETLEAKEELMSAISTAQKNIAAARRRLLARQGKQASHGL